MNARRADLDVVRFGALVSMYVAHVAPTPGPGRLLALSEYLTLPLFALLIGSGAHLAARRAAATGNWQHWWRSLGVRAGALLGLGLLLERAGAEVVIVLVYLGALALVAGLLARCHPAVVAVAGLVAFVLTSWLRQAHLEAVVSGAAVNPDSWWGEVGLFLWAGQPYRLGSLIVHAALGILLARWLIPDRASSGSGQAARIGVGVGATFGAIAIFGAERVGRLELAPYSGTAMETLLCACLAVGFMGLGLVLARGLPDWLARPWAATGAMTLTLYVLQIGWLAYDVRVLHPGARDDSWLNLAVLVAGSLLVVTVWHLAVRTEPWRRGPLEGALSALADGRRPIPRGHR